MGPLTFGRPSAEDLGEGVSQQLLGARPVLGLHEDAAHKVARLVRDVQGQRRVGGLGGDLEYGRHGLVLGPRRLLRQHLHHRAAEAPGEERRDPEKVRKQKGVPLRAPSRRRPQTAPPSGEGSIADG